jgi:L,D-peptidoglycan transpeptidase YkuD (ErfK/YbiS/YcfS/YnhG family)
MKKIGQSGHYFVPSSLLLISLVMLCCMVVACISERSFSTDFRGAARRGAQIIFVAADSGRADVSMYEKAKDGRWTLLLKAVGHSGKNGIGKTREGDSKSPSGIYRLSMAFGVKDNPGTAMPYVKVDSHCYWVSDSHSRYYNRFVRDDKIIRDWNDAEHLIAAPHSYAYVLAVGYNERCRKGLGSAIFFHCAMDETTEGCITIPEADMVRVMRLIRPGCVIDIDSPARIEAQMNSLPRR